MIANRSKIIIIDALMLKEPLSRPEIIEITKLSQTTVHLITKSLIEDGIIKEDRIGHSSGGRKPVLLRINKKGGFALGIKIDESGIYTSLVDLGGNTCIRRKDSLPPSNNEIEVIETLIKCIKKLLAKNNEYDFIKILGIGIGITGIVNYFEGILIKSHLLSWKNIRFKVLLEKEFKIPVFLDNDVNVLLSAESRYGRWKMMENIVCIMIGYGIGGGIITNNNVYRGSYGASAEFGHMVIDKNGPLCRCGRQGCLTVLASDEFIIKEVEKSISQGRKTKISKLMVDGKLNQPSMKIIIDALLEGDELASEIYEKALKNLVIGLVNIINIIDPQIILIGREKLPTESILIEKIGELLKDTTQYAYYKKIKIVPFSLQKDGWNIGAADLVFQKIIRTPMEIQ